MSRQSRPAVFGRVASLCRAPALGRDRAVASDGRWMLAWHLVFYVMLLGLTAALVVSRPGAVTVAAGVVLAALMAGWYAAWMILRPDLVVGSIACRVTYFAVGAALWFGLVMLSPNFANLGIIALGQLFGYLRSKWAFAGAVVVLLVWLVGVGLDGSVAVAGMPRWRGIDWGVAGGATLTVGLIALCLYSFGELFNTRSELAGAERQAGVLGERQRIAGEIHDTLTQSLASVVMLLEAAQTAYKSGRPEAGRRIEEAARTAREGLHDVRRLVWDLRPEALERGTLANALARLTAQVGEQTMMMATTVVTGEVRHLEPELEVTLLRVAQEALANVRRHSHARTVTVTLSYMEGEVALDVQDDGRGFDPTLLAGANPGGGLGLITMRERVEALGGTLTVESEPGEGATVVARLSSEGQARSSLPSGCTAAAHP